MTTAMMEQTLPEPKAEHLPGLLREAVSKFRSGEDAAGIESLFSAMKELENAVEAEKNSLRFQIAVARLLPVMRKLRVYLQNQDIAGIADLLEDALCPAVEESGKGCEGA